MDHPKNQDLILKQRMEAAPAAEARSVVFAQPAEEDGAGALLEYAAIARRHAGLVALASLAGLVLGSAVSLLQTPIYQARATVEIERPNDRFLDLENLLPTTLDEPYSIDSELATQIRVLTSRPLVDAVIQRLDLTEELTPVPGTKARLLAGLGLGDPPLSATDATLEALHVEPSGLSRVVDIYFEHADPKVAEAFANGLAEEFIRQSVESRWHSAERTAEWLSGELGSTRERLAEVQNKLQQMARSNGIVSLAGGSTLAEERLRLIQDDLSRAQSERIASESRWEQARALPEAEAASAIDDQALRDHELRLADLRVQLNALTTKFKPGYTGVKALQSQVDYLERKIDDERGEILERARNQFEAAVKREAMIDEQHRRYSGVVASQKVAAIEFDLLRQEAETTRQLYDNLLRKIKESKVAATIGATHIRMVDPATVPPNPIRPQPLLTSGLGLALGLIVGLVVATSKSRSAPAVLRPGDIPRTLGTPELACIPTLTSPDAMRLKTAGLLTLSRDRAQGHAANVAAAGDALATASFQNLMTSILLGRRADSPQVLAVSSPSAGDGKSTTVYNLAVSLATGGERVLVVDGNLASPVQHELFGVAQRLGLGDLLEVGADESGALGADEARRSDSENLHLITEGALETAHPDLKNLHLMTAGMVRSNAARLLHCRGFAGALMQRFRLFDVVLIDTPAVLDNPDARIFARLADAVALVLRADSTPVQDALAARNRFLSDRTSIAGAVLNDCERTADRSKKTSSAAARRRSPMTRVEGSALPLSSSREGPED
jgi:uncharacterized protein involved in exopolysaccharide biosynthesis/Mrp family chromosome partitioning ATPase